MTTSSARISFDRRQILKAGGILAIGFSMSRGGGPAGAATLLAPKSVAKDAVDSWLTIGPDDRITIFCGKVDLGTGARTALAQLAAEELDVAFGRIEMVMGDTATTPDQWLTAGNLTIFQGGSELRRAAASARRALVERAAQRLGVPASELTVEDGVVRVRAAPAQSLRYGELIGDGIKLQVDEKIALKKNPEYKVIGKSIPRVDIPGKVTGEFTYIHDVRLPEMLHARVIRPDHYGARVVSVDDSASRQVNGFVQTVRKGDFVAVVARNEWAAVVEQLTRPCHGGPVDPRCRVPCVRAQPVDLEVDCTRLERRPAGTLAELARLARRAGAAAPVRRQHRLDPAATPTTRRRARCYPSRECKRSGSRTTSVAGSRCRRPRRSNEIEWLICRTRRLVDAPIGSGSSSSGSVSCPRGGTAPHRSRIRSG